MSKSEDPLFDFLLESLEEVGADAPAKAVKSSGVAPLALGIGGVALARLGRPTILQIADQLSGREPQTLEQVVQDIKTPYLRWWEVAIGLGFLSGSDRKFTATAIGMIVGGGAVYLMKGSELQLGAITGVGGLFGRASVLKGDGNAAAEFLGLIKK